MAQKYANHIPSPLENLKTNIKNSSKILLLDGFFANIKGEDNCVHIAFDTAIGVVDFWQDSTENKQAYGYILSRLQAVGYKPICIVSDGHWGVKTLCEEDKIPHQRCIFHTIKYLRDQLSDHGELLKGNKVLYSRIKGILKSSSVESLEKKVQSFRKILPHFQTPRQKRILEWFFKVLPNATIHLSFEEKNTKNYKHIRKLEWSNKSEIKNL